MSDYIEREAALESVRDKVLICESLPDTIAKDASLFTLASMNDSLKNIPAADVRPVVRCKDCRHNRHCLIQDFIEDHGVTPDEQSNFFCGYGMQVQTNESKGE